MVVRSEGTRKRETRKRETNGDRPIPIAAGGSSLLRPLKAAEVIARNIVGDIRAQNLRPGDGLPSEAAMLTQYGVSRESLREGLRLLEVQGMIAIRRGPGGGPVVGSVGAAHLGRVSALFFHMSGATYQELFEAWVWGQGELAERAARHPDADTRASTMAPFMDGHHHESDELLEGYLEEHAGFHGAVASLVRNRVLELSLESYGQIVAHHVAMVDDPRTLRSVLVDDHHKIARAVAAGQPKRARDLMEEHLRGVVDYCRDRLGGSLDSAIEWL
ncbi:GntR family transcriptional regulator (plasmid) [Rhodococcus opacus]|uniref:GntR family transcriptional regulator n=1 Tax=Rhodococcus opacus TaxID=37919 RepID=A0AAX3YSI6_RHOOP|nr:MULTISPECIES: FCD domain-containing protein [Rhodococcus]NHU48219.1 FadR family transcriptional regulator [Rhodococcus sp. A14]RYF47472.1 MAG: FadR family transcriptional regulator [Comamonadaceae bacterium]MCZ4589256.1 GntR family transcriptional regulator [Rhodococcus opacus]QSE85923.1 FadR family transcriptional regulator [Rhodococcus koreensis]WKN60990.1 GntR family transcriptional regulator [Rhodococcus opacus]